MAGSEVIMKGTRYRVETKLLHRIFDELSDQIPLQPAVIYRGIF